MNILQSVYSRLFGDRKKEIPETTTMSKPKQEGKNTKFRMQLAADQKEMEENVEKIKKEFEEASKIAGEDPIMKHCLEYYYSTFDPNQNERAIGMSFIGQKVIPRAVPLVKQAISDLISRQKIKFEELNQEEYLEQLLSSQLESRTNFS